jgi:hypothetical protein
MRQSISAALAVAAALSACSQPQAPAKTAPSSEPAKAELVALQTATQAPLQIEPAAPVVASQAFAQCFVDKMKGKGWFLNGADSFAERNAQGVRTLLTAVTVPGSKVVTVTKDVGGSKLAMDFTYGVRSMDYRFKLTQFDPGMTLPRVEADAIKACARKALIHSKK